MAEPDPRKKRAEALARQIAERLFTNGADERADHLVLMAGERDLGGWAFESAVYQIVYLLLMESPHAE